MGTRLAAAALLACAGAAGRCPPRLPAESSLRYTVELEGLREAAQRLELRTSGWRLLALERGAGLDPDFLAFGLECPWAAVGRLVPRGLVRVLADPLGYSPASAVFSEPPGFRLESAMEGAPRRGLWLEPLPGRLGLFLVGGPPGQAEDPGAGLLAGGGVRFCWPGPGQTAGRSASPSAFAPPVRVEAQALALLSHPEADPETGPGTDGPTSPLASGEPASLPSDWLLDRPPFPGGGLLHMAGALRLEAGGGRLACYLLAAASGGQRVPAGLLGLWRLEAEGRSWSVRALLGSCSAEYRLPQGESYAGAWAAGLHLEVEPRPELRLGADWRGRIDRPPAASGGGLAGNQEGGVSAKLAVALRAGGRLEARAAAEARAEYAADGGMESSAGADLGLELHGPPRSLALGLRGGWEEGAAGLRGELGGELRGERGGVRLQAGAAVRAIASGTVWHPFGRLELAGESFRFWLAAGTGDGGREVSVGWSAVQAVSKSPTVRTSRSRR